MNYFDARQRKDKKWDYTCKNDGAIWPVGYCDKYHPMDKEACSKIGMPFNPAYLEKEERFKHKHHTDGHSSKEEACECYRNYLLDQQLRFSEDREDPDTLHKCAVCKTMTSGTAEIDYQQWNLCKEHRTRDCVEKLFPSVGWMASS